MRLKRNHLRSLIKNHGNALLRAVLWVEDMAAHGNLKMRPCDLSKATGVSWSYAVQLLPRARETWGSYQRPMNPARPDGVPLEVLSTTRQKALPIIYTFLTKNNISAWLKDGRLRLSREWTRVKIAKATGLPEETIRDQIRYLVTKNLLPAKLTPTTSDPIISPPA